MTQNSQWGPPLWRVLHTVAERLGVNQNSLVATDEARTFVQLLRVTEGVMPCPLCRKHFHQWILSHSPAALELRRGPSLRLDARRWLWSLHENVNHTRGVSGMTLEDAEAHYSAISKDAFQKDIDALNHMFTVAMQTSLVNPNHVRSWKALLSLLRRLVSF